MSTTEYINKLYSIPRFQFTTGSPTEYTWNIIVISIVLIVILFLYIQNNVNVDMKNWNVVKCTPKYIFFSGYLHNDNPSLSASETTIKNFFECTNKYATGTSDSLGGDLEHVFNGAKNSLMQFDQENVNKNTTHRSEMEHRAMDISAQLDALETKVQFSLDASSTVVYSELKNIGLYVDQLNQYMNYIGAYVKQYLSYKMMTHANNCMSDTTQTCDSDHKDYQKALRIKEVLNTYYGGNSL